MAAHQAPLSLGFSRQKYWSGCHFLLQWMKVKSESKVAQSCPTLRDPMDCSLPGSSVHGIFQARVLEWVAIAFSTMIQQMLAIWSLVPLPFLNSAWTSGSSWYVFEHLLILYCILFWKSLFCQGDLSLGKFLWRSDLGSVTLVTWEQLKVPFTGIKKVESVK